MVRSLATMDELRRDISQAGGLHSKTGLARRWGVSKTYISQAVQHPDFPEPVTEIDGREVWAGVAADTWRNTPRKPGPKTKD